MFTVDRDNRFPMTLDEKIEPRYWDFKNQKVKPTYRGHYEINEFLLEKEYNLMKLYRENREMPFEQFKVLAQGKREEKKTLFLVLGHFLTNYSTEKDVKTLKKYNTLLHQLQEFDSRHPIDFGNLDFNFYDSFKQFLYGIPNPNYKKYCLVRVDGNSGDFILCSREGLSGNDGLSVGLFDDTVYKYIINLKTFLKWAEKRGHKIHQSFKAWEIIRRKHAPVSLTLSELERLENHKFEWKSEDIARDYLVLQCRTGQRISDIKRFNLKDFSGDKWTFTPKKGSRISSKTVTVHFKGFCAPALEILQKYNWKLPVVSEQKINKHIKSACEKAGINSPVDYIRWAQNKKIVMTGPKYEFCSNHTGRRSFCTLCLEQGLSIEFVMNLTGISNYSTVQHYRGRFEDSAIENELEKISNKSPLRKAQ